ncbi:MAG: hypothetical protein ACJA1L_001127 [Paracoccaceae bacterium]|jgi:hypothetical protein
MIRSTKGKSDTRAVALIATGMVAANAVFAISVAVIMTIRPEALGISQSMLPAGLGSPHLAAAAGAMVFALSGFASALAMRLAAPSASAEAQAEAERS